MGLVNVDNGRGSDAALRFSSEGGDEAADARPLTILIADHAPTRAGIKLALAGKVEVCGEVADADHAIRDAMRAQPDLCLVGCELGGGWLAAVRGICRAAPRCAVVVLSEVEEVDDLLDAVRAGAIGYVPGPLDAHRLRTVVDAIAAEEAVIPRSMVLELLLELRSGGSGADALTARESQVLGMLRRGHSTAAIAERLAIAPVTVRRHISELVHKLGVADRAELLGAQSRWPSPSAGRTHVRGVA